MGTLIDPHLHTQFSSCSNFDIDTFVNKVHELSLPVITVTDHGSAKACAELIRRLPNVLVVWGIEVTTQEGDFLIYSEDKKYIQSLGIYLKSVTDIRRDPETAVVWAHPRVPQIKGWVSPSAQNPEIERVLSNVDALEIFNGTMLNLAVQGLVRPPYFANLNDLAVAHKVFVTGGSDAHEAELYRACWTEFEDPIASAADFVRSLKNGRVKPGYDKERFKFEADMGPVWEPKA